MSPLVSCYSHRPDYTSYTEGRRHTWPRHCSKGPTAQGVTQIPQDVYHSGFHTRQTNVHSILRPHPWQSLGTLTLDLCDLMARPHRGDKLSPSPATNCRRSRRQFWPATKLSPCMIDNKLSPCPGDQLSPPIVARRHFVASVDETLGIPSKNVRSLCMKCWRYCRCCRPSRTE